MFEYRRCFVEAPGKNANQLAGGGKKIIGQSRDMKDAVFFRGCDVIGGLIIIDKEGHVARHLARDKVATENKVPGKLLSLIFEVPKLFKLAGKKWLLLFFRHVQRPVTGVWTERPNDAIWAL